MVTQNQLNRLIELACSNNTSDLELAGSLSINLVNSGKIDIFDFMRVTELINNSKLIITYKERIGQITKELKK